MATSLLADLLHCPRCQRDALLSRGTTLACPGCRAEYPSVDGIPWLFPAPAQALGEWRNRLSQYLEEFRAAGRAIAAELPAVTAAATRERLQRLAAAYADQERRVAGLLAPLGLVDTPLAEIAQQAFGTRLSLRQDLHSYYTNIHRDWAWGDAENDASRDLVATALGLPHQRVLVLGAGACRLAYDLHQSGSQETTVALDINPLLLLVARRVLAGETVELVEFPLAPRTLEDVAVHRQLRAPAAVRPGLELVFADAWQAPFAPQTFDAVVTPWLVDIVDVDFATIALHVNRLLAAGGRWVNFGSLAFPWRRASLRLSPAEIVAVLREAGFNVPVTRDATLPYMRSPASRHSRVEEVLLFAADKHGPAARPPDVPPAPPWLADPSLPVPPSTAFFVAANASRIQAVVLGLVDGQRSLDDLVRIVAEQGLLPPDQAGAAVHGLLERIHASAERGASRP